MELMAGRVEGIISGLLADDHQTFVCQKTLRSERRTCAGAVGVMSKLGRLPLIARLGLVMGLITKQDIEASAAMVIDPPDVQCMPRAPRRQSRRSPF